MSVVQEKENFIFDLYGTLLDIWTEEEDQRLWIWLAKKYDEIGCHYSASGIKRAYHQLVRVKEHKLGLREKTSYPEIELREVFRELITMERREDSTKSVIMNRDMEDPNVMKWVNAVAYEFRKTSRRRFQLYEDTIPTLTRLKEMQKRIYLLSNAQNCFTVPEMKELKLEYYFDAIYISSDHQYKKPAKQFMGKLLREQGLRVEDSIMIGNDFSSDVASAVQYDMDAVFLNTDGYSAREMQKRLNEVRDRYQKNVSPYRIVSGRLLELFTI